MTGNNLVDGFRKIMDLFASPWVDSRGIVFPDKQNHSKPLVTGIKSTTISPSLRVSMNTHNIYRNLASKTNKMARYIFGLERYTDDQKFDHIPWVCLRGPARSFPKLNSSPPPRGKKNYQNCTIPPPFPWTTRGSAHGEANNQCIIAHQGKVIHCWQSERKRMGHHNGVTHFQGSFLSEGRKRGKEPWEQGWRKLL